MVLGSEDEDISRAHCRIDINDQGQCYLVDVGSARGTHLNGTEIIGRSALRDRDTFIIGQTQCEFRGN